jgi:hypothetical protein
MGSLRPKVIVLKLTFSQDARPASSLRPETVHMVRKIIIKEGHQKAVEDLDLPLLLIKFQHAIDSGIRVKDDDDTKVKLLLYVMEDLEIHGMNRTQWTDNEYVGLNINKLDILTACLDSLFECALLFIDRSIQEAVDEHYGGTIRQESIITLRRGLAQAVDLNTFVAHCDAMFKIITTNTTARD